MFFCYLRGLDCFTISKLKKNSFIEKGIQTLILIAAFPLSPTRIFNSKSTLNFNGTVGSFQESFYNSLGRMGVPALLQLVGKILILIKIKHDVLSYSLIAQTCFSFIALHWGNDLH